MRKNEILKFLSTKSGTLALTIILYIVSFLLMSLLGGMSDSIMNPSAESGSFEGILSVVAIISSLIWVYFGWKALTFITPRIFLIMPLVGWIIYFCIKGFLAILVGIFVTPYYIAKTIRNHLSGVSVDDDYNVAEHETKNSNDLMTYTKSDLQKFTMDELHNIYMDLTDIIYSIPDAPDSMRIPSNVKSYGCKTFGEAAFLLDLIVEAEKIKSSNKKTTSESVETMTDSEKQQLNYLGKLDVVTKAFNNALKGDSESMLFLAMVYNKDLINPKKSFYWMEKAANKNNAQARYFLGTYYIKGYGVAESKTKGISSILSSAERGNTDAINFCTNELKMSAEQMRECGISI